MKITEQTKYIAYFSTQKAPYFDQPDSGGWYNFSYTPLCSGLKDTAEEAKKHAPHVFGTFSIHKIQITRTVFDSHLPFSVNRTSSNRWLASCSRCLFTSNGAKSTIEFALDNIKNRAEGTVCSLEEFVDLGVVEC